MPTATKLSHLGWFPMEQTDPTCLEKVDVSGFDYWTTLGGVTKDSPTPTTAKIGESVENASKLFWNLYQINVTSTVGGTTIFTDINTDDDADTPATIGEPLDRICLVDWYKIADSSNVGGGNSFLEASVEIVRMYNGATTNESNFVGLGVKTLDTANFNNPIFIQLNDAIAQFANVELLSYGNENTSVSSISNLYDIGYSTFQDIPFVAECAVALDLGGGSVSVANLLADSGGGDVAQFNSLEFYTYT